MAALAAGLLLGPAAGCASTGGPAQRPSSASFTENGVTVDLSVDRWDGTAGTLTAVFTPTAAGYHLYSLDLPPGGVDGIGRPVSLKLRGGLEQTARPTTGAAVHDLQLPGGLPPVPVYPDGPVTVTLPVHRTAEGPATVLVGYAACSETKGCLFPVDAHPVEATVDGTSVRFAGPGPASPSG
ncbi:hypothetical protein [Kitasatospora arboriphila]|uniref:Thiol:disulfide interchange protein DsbD N-terminal domain-containing protein n=1 Tax=Kitasatospora arboriphila TaxID=258052 RepID=A0ABP4EGX5_9ACTN